MVVSFGELGLSTAVGAGNETVFEPLLHAVPLNAVPLTALRHVFLGLSGVFSNQLRVFLGLSGSPVPVPWKTGPHGLHPSLLSAVKQPSKMKDDSCRMVFSFFLHFDQC